MLCDWLIWIYGPWKAVWHFLGPRTAFLILQAWCDSVKCDKLVIRNQPISWGKCAILQRVFENKISKKLQREFEKFMEILCISSYSKVLYNIVTR